MSSAVDPEGRASPTASTISSGLLAALVAVLVAIFICFLALPCVGLLLNVRSADVWAALGQDYVQEALWLTLRTSLIAVAGCALFGTPLAYALARMRFRGKRLLRSLVQLPMVLPPVVSGVALLMAFGRRGLLGGHLEALGLQIPFTPLAVVLAQVFMASPFFVLAFEAGLQSVPRSVEEASRTLGASEFKTFLRVTLPLTWPAFVSGMVLAWGRALGEFGATIMFAGNMRGETRTMTLAILTAMQGDVDAALALSVLLLVFSSVIFVAANFILQPRLRILHA